jgi:hypothetical protein
MQSTRHTSVSNRAPWLTNPPSSSSSSSSSPQSTTASVLWLVVGSGDCAVHKSAADEQVREENTARAIWISQYGLPTARQQLADAVHQCEQLAYVALIVQGQRAGASTKWGS